MTHLGKTYLQRVQRLFQAYSLALPVAAERDDFPWGSAAPRTPRSAGGCVPMPGGALRLYHCGKVPGPNGHCIGCVESATGDVSPGAWKPVVA